MNNNKKFPLISGNISIDLVNTEVVRNGTRNDLFTTVEDVIDWIHTLEEEKVIFPYQLRGGVDKWAEEALPILRDVRSFLREGYEQVADGNKLSGDWVCQLEELIKKAPFTYSVQDDELIPIPVGKSSDAIASLIAYDALNLFTNNQLSYMHRCANPDCVLLFIDTRGRRKWCSMKICGNREKVTRHLKLKKGK
ncbi:CGNR zinc finger domain-containing protein [Heyndrickxia sporothermodurans]|uniref:CGNR zinc finger domain-containing protein n=1 Tax=Heyndrickxia sporothermodurans TaxID=46224 RepID=A0AB37HJN4_9BACI|nr:CGNR zinc finger domain-containing protein [Heyndrickxia sporothermodurans]MBL5769168.1 CGNR zinc finger domain-containing protein [Heyndrickxia sporothermodurans]MBL5772951.1 CGNR zinc finger domain-containing protein [Heyndrickxia sporothermodurans]MBL5776408.1 CGNR zinc finger domain-containing protein [Heyndrickxia sporothermodurans]MBL5780071.1 CGNR zinc finger domain-containing protein [Heyndrickxia sporothermodurans]MBL5782670.1 CGNR zinc finger domain-containing protein [Heyndrickxi